MTRKERYQRVLDHFRQNMGHPTTELDFGSVFQLLVAVMLSAHCTDKRVNMVTPALFARFPDADALSRTQEDEVYEYVRSVSYPNAKARHLVQMARMLMEEYGGEVPQTMEQLVRLPGVGRKTANVIEAVAFGHAAMPVDTHVFRVSHRLGLVPRTATTPYKVEMALRSGIPEEDLADAHHWLLLHGRYTCVARKPKCPQCPFDSFCAKNGLDGNIQK